MKTRLRIATIFFAMILPGAFLFAAIALLTLNQAATQSAALLIPALLFGGLCAGAVIAIIWLTVLIDINEDRRTITFTFPFRFQQFVYAFDDVVGFRYKYLTARVDYKSMKFRTKSDQRTFSVSDFETSNLRDLEHFCLQHFDLRADSEFRALSEHERQMVIRESRRFDFNQAKEIRIYTAFYILLLIFVCGFIVKELVMDPNKFKTLIVVFFTMVILTILAIRKLLRVHRQVRNTPENIRRR